ncbi:MAG: leucine-rich repeat protein [Clostridia bacterium]|nr:leucine-rich repeat protein [Clostridia bacterium]
MNKRFWIKIGALLGVFALLFAIFATQAIASPTIKVTFNYGDRTVLKYLEGGVPFSTPDATGSADAPVLGWADKDGNLYQCGDSVTLDSTSTLYLIYGLQSVSTGEELLSSLSSGYTYIKLGSDITLNQQLVVNSPVLYIDTNGYTLTLNTEGEGILASDTGIIFAGEGEVKHTYADANPNFITNSFISLTPNGSFNNLFITVCKGATASTNLGFACVNGNVSRYSGVFSLTVNGTISCEKLVTTSGMANGTVSLPKDGTVNTTGEYLYLDTSNIESSNIITTTVTGGSVLGSSMQGFAKDMSKYKVVLSSGYFTNNLTNSFPDKNYSFQKDNKTGLYRFHACSHSGPVIGGMPDDCPPTANLTYQCMYCDKIYERNTKIGHTEIVTISSDYVTTEEETKPGYYKYYCQRCGNARYVPFYPDPSEVYVSVVVRDANGKIKTLRVPSYELYSFSSAKPSVVTSFSTEYIQYNYSITQENILSVEIPLGTTEIYGNYQHNAASGVFCRNPHLEEVIFPESIKNINQYAFYHMDSLKKLTGLEYITGNIAKCAFEQEHHNVVFDKEQMVINANSIGEYAFKNILMTSLKFGDNVSTISKGAFGLSGTYTIIGEVLIEGGTKNNVPVATAMVGYVNYNSSEQQFGSLPVAFSEHQCISTVTPATCTEDGYTHHVCKYCTYERIDSYTEHGNHDLQTAVIVPTCADYGYTVEKCTLCGYEDESTIRDGKAKDPNNHAYNDGQGPIFVDVNTALELESGAMCRDYYYMADKCVCGALKSVSPLPPLQQPNKSGHSWDLSEENYINYKAPNCGDWGEATVKCTVCSETTVIHFDPLPSAHKWDNGTVIKEATCTEKGMKMFKCTVCDTEDGTKNVSTPINPSNHNWNEGEITKKPTELSAGIRTLACTRCFEKTTQGIPRLQSDHSMPTWAIVLIVIGGVLLVAGGVLTLYFTFFKKKRASDGYKYKFNTLK